MILEIVTVKSQLSKYPTKKIIRVHSWGLIMNASSCKSESSKVNRAFSFSGVTIISLDHRMATPPSSPAWQTLNHSKVTLNVIFPVKNFLIFQRPNCNIALSSVSAMIHIFPLNCDHINLE